eukprot:scaffold286922_cov27-Tisochrysis_lutea.AAC.1
MTSSMHSQDLDSLRAEVSEASRVLCQPGTAETCNHSHEQQVSPSGHADGAPAESSPYCTMVGEMDGGELDAWPSNTAGTPADSVMHSQGPQGHSA